MADEKLLNGLPVFFSSYVKRWMEQHYDTLMRSAPVRPLMEAGAPTRYGVEAAMYALLAYADQHWSANTPLHAILREVAVDAPAEIGKRLVNGFREELLAAGKTAASDQATTVEQTLLQLDDATLGAILGWLARLSPADRDHIRSLLGTLSEEQLQRVARLEPEALDALTQGMPPVATPPSHFSQAIRDEMRQAHQRVDEQLAAIRKGRQA